MAHARKTNHVGLKSQTHEEIIEEELHDINEHLEDIAVSIGILTGVLAIIAIIIGVAFL